MTDVQGYTAPGFEAVRDAFVENLETRAERGGAFSAYHRGEKVVDLWAGEAAPGRPWEEDTMVVVFSATKGLAAYVVQVLVEAGELDLDKTVADYWPEFAANGKDSVTVREVLTHAARLPYPPNYASVATFDSIDGWDNTSALLDLLANGAQLGDDGDHGYHALTFGLLVGEIVRGATGQSLGEIFAERVAGPLELSTFIGLPASEQDRLAEISLTIPPPPTDDPEILAMMAEAMSNEGPVGRALMIGSEGFDNLPDVVNNPRFSATEQAAASGVSDARSLARLYGMLANGGELDGTRFVSAASIAAHSAEQWHGIDTSLGAEKRYAVGFMLAGTEAETFGPNPDAFGHPGLGGSIGFADPAAAIGVGYITNHAVLEVRTDPRGEALVEALYGCL